jgi:hypothetical protein
VQDRRHAPGHHELHVGIAERARHWRVNWRFAVPRGPPLRLEPEYTREPFYDDVPFGPDSYAE